MQNDTVADQDQYLNLAAKVVMAFIANNSVPVSSLPLLISKVYSAFTTLGASVEIVAEESIEKLTAAQIRKSVTPDHLTSFIDGKAYKTLKRHLSVHGLDPNSYRLRYGLSADYPMVAPAYAAKRSSLAKEIGLGRVGATTRRPRKAA